ncbi:carotenoid oxygenase family protein [Corallococcus interemptor]|uniref:carotenoid oxygenase family protein n=1 Tax=Corallococcus interemptor TaxID=2316720 RepID=UPI003D021724
MTAFDLSRGAGAPVADEVDHVELRVTGSIPRELDGTLLRNGPNPLRGRFEGNDVPSSTPQRPGYNRRQSHTLGMAAWKPAFS